MANSALVLFSGGQDSTTCLAWALSRFDHVETIGFDYRQRHSVELACRKPILDALRNDFPHWGQKLERDHLIDLGVLGQISDTALTQSKIIELESSGLPNTFVPGRNLLFLTLAAAVAYRRDIGTLIGGMCETDYSGYPDCRNNTMLAMQLALNLGLDKRTRIETPLMWLDKAGTWSLAESLGGQVLIDLVRKQTHTCYMGDHATENEWGYGCGTCPACELRSQGYDKYRRVGSCSDTPRPKSA